MIDSRSIKDIKDLSSEYPFGKEPFGDLLIIKLHHKDEKGKYWFNCQCVKCGKIIKEPLRFDTTIKMYGRTTKCDCIIKKPREFEDLTGRKFGYLLVKKYAGKTCWHDSLWDCLCTRCNKNHSIVSRSNLTKIKNPITMCNECAYQIRGEKNRKRIINIGEKYGRLIVKKKDFFDKATSQWFWICKCILCEFEDSYSTNSLIDYSKKEDARICHRCKDVKDLTGEKFGRLTVISFAYFKNNKAWWNCKCECGDNSYIIANSSSLTTGNTRSCGCLTVENNKARAIHGDWNKPLYVIYKDMKQRCNNSNCKFYGNYGGRGIKVDDEWNASDGYKKFKEDMAETYMSGLSLDRRDVNGDYTKDNCRWISMAEQQRNKTTNRPIDYNGKHYNCTQDLIDEMHYNSTDIRSSSSSICGRIDIGWSVKEALIIPKLNGETKSTWLKRHNIKSDDQLPDTPIKNAVYFDEK